MSPQLKLPHHNGIITPPRSTDPKPVMTTLAQSPVAAHQLQCMEVWGGNQRIEHSVSVPGVDAWISSTVFGQTNQEDQGGDICYLSNCMAGRISRFAVADVSGHGSGVADLAITLRRLMRKHINTPDQSGLARALNREFSTLSDSGQFATALLASYVTVHNQLVVCNAGHPPPLWFDASKSVWSWLSADPASNAQEGLNLPLGIIEPTDYSQFIVRLGVGDLVAIYTDALPEARNDQGQQLGQEGLAKLIEGVPTHDPQVAGRELIRRIDQHRGSSPHDDDQTLMILRHTGQKPPRYTIRQRLETWGRLLGVTK